jgi:twinkle protein
VDEIQPGMDEDGLMTTLVDALAEYGIRHRNLRLTPGANSALPCPKAERCGAKQPNDLCFSVKIDDDGQGAVWNCKRASCGGDAGSVRLKEGPTGFHRREVKTYRRPSPVADAKPTDKMLEWFLSQRGISTPVVKEAGIYATSHWFYPKGDEKEGRMMSCIAFPYYRDGELVNVKYRTHDKRFMQEQGAEKIFYGLDNVRNHATCVIVEGEMDVLACRSAGIENVISVPDGAPERVKDGPIDPDNDSKFEYVWNCIDTLEQMDRIILAFDADRPGLALEAEIARRIGKEKCFRVRWPEAVGDVQIKDANDCLLHMGAHVLRECIDDARPFPIEDLYSARDFLPEVMKIYRGEVAQGFSTGFQSLDEFFKFTFNGTLIIVSGIPGHGKSEFFDQLAINIAERHRVHTAYCSFENDPPEHLTKLSEKYTRKPFENRFGGPSRMTEGELMDAVEWLDKYFCFMETQSSSPSLEWILEKAKAAVQRYGIKLLIIDPWNRIEHQKPKNMSDTDYIAFALDKMQRFGKSHGVDVVLVAHPAKMRRSDGGAEPVPTPYDISGAAHFFNMASACVAVWRNRDDIAAPVQVHVQKMKHKRQGKEGMVEFVWNRSNGTYMEIIGTS